MSTTQAGVILRHLRTFVATEQPGSPTDRQLLEQFATRREEGAFEALLRRHAPLVLGVCRRVLRQEQDAEDAFQATFLVLARKAQEVGRRGSVAGWLHRVAYHAAIRARARTASREQHERQAPPRQPTDLLGEVTGRELFAMLDEELQQLSEVRRAPLVLCYLQGHTCDEAARQLGCSLRTLKRRLDQARQCLRARLARRGLALPAAILALGLTCGAKAAVPAGWVAAAVRAATGAGSGATAAGAIAEAVLRGMSPTPLRWVAALLVLGTLIFGTGVLARHAQAQRPDAEEPPLPAPAAAAPPLTLPAAPSKEVADAKKAAITGRVVDADGKPVAGARVAGYGGLEFGSLSVEYQAKSLGEVKTDADGCFRLAVPETPGGRFRHIELLSAAKGHGAAWSRATVGNESEVELRLPPEEAVVGRLIDLQGQPLAKAQLRPRRVLSAEPPRGPKLAAPKEGDAAASDMRHLLALQRRSQSFEFWKDSPIKDFSLWPKPVTTDAEGRFRVTGFGRGQEVDLFVEDDRVAAQEIIVTAGHKARDFSLVPPHKVSGRLVAADTDKAIAGVSVWVTSFHDRLGYGVDVRTDADGRYTANAYPGESYLVTAYPPRGEPYLVAFRQADWPKGAVKQEVDLKLPRGAVVRGKVVEAGTGKALVSATLAFVPQSEGNPERPRGILSGQEHKYFSRADGTFEMVVPPGRGHLIVTGPSPEYTYRTVSEAELLAGKPGGPPHHFHAVVALDLRAKGDAKELKIELRRAVKIKGRLVGPDGKPVKDAVVFLPSELLPPRQPAMLSLVFGVPPGTRVAAVSARDGAFELPNCDPEATYRIYVLSGKAEGANEGPVAMPRPGGVFEAVAGDSIAVVNRLIGGKNPLGAVADLSAKAAGGKAVEVKLVPCESAEVRFADAKGKAVPQKVWLELLVKPGPTAEKSRVAGKPAAEAALLGSPHSLWNEKSPLAPDADGRITLRGLIPGATYRLTIRSGQEGLENEIVFDKYFTVEAGKKTKLELPAPEAK
jgi:RNA polymerase sigma factor (sigma-70 family)